MKTSYKTKGAKNKSASKKIVISSLSLFANKISNTNVIQVIETFNILPYNNLVRMTSIQFWTQLANSRKNTAVDSLDAHRDWNRRNKNCKNLIGCQKGF